MSNQVETFWPHFTKMVEERGINVTPELEKGVRLLIDNMVTSDNADMVEKGLNLAPGSATLYTTLLEYLAAESEDVSDEEFSDEQERYADLWNAQATILSMTTPAVGAKFSIVSLED